MEADSPDARWTSCEPSARNTHAQAQRYHPLERLTAVWVAADGLMELGPAGAVVWSLPAPVTCGIARCDSKIGLFAAQGSALARSFWI